jgi:hypothetical protein
MARSLPSEILWHNPGFSKDTYNPPTVGRAFSSRTQALRVANLQDEIQGTARHSRGSKNRC